jgi:cytochrome c
MKVKSMSRQSKIFQTIALTSSAAILAAFAAAGSAQGGNIAGRSAFQRRCTGCHALDHEKAGPRLAGVLGRKAGTVPGFPYSDAVKKSAVVWNEAVLDKWLTDPETVIPDTDMAFRLDNPVERAAIIAFLKETGK